MENAALDIAFTLDIAFMRAQREKSAALVAEGRKRTEDLRVGLERARGDASRAFGSQVALRFLAIRQRHRAAAARLTSGRLQNDHKGTRDEEVDRQGPAAARRGRRAGNGG